MFIEFIYDQVQTGYCNGILVALELVVAIAACLLFSHFSCELCITARINNDINILLWLPKCKILHCNNNEVFAKKVFRIVNQKLNYI